MKNKITITIGRQLGSGGRDIGKKISKDLHLEYYDKEILTMASEKSGLRSEFFEQTDEKHSNGFWGNLLNYSSPQNNYFLTYYGGLSNEKLFTIQSRAIKEAAKEKSSLFIGRCADYVLRNNEDCINLFITANINDRIKRISDRHKLEKKEAKKIIEKTDKTRSSYYNYFTNNKWGEALHYDMCINSSILGIDETADYIETLIKML